MKAVKFKVFGCLVLLVSIILCAFCVAQASSIQGGGTTWENYILVVDNSGSNLPNNANGSSDGTDPLGLRFSACKYIYEEIKASQARIGLILYSGSRYKFVHGPVEVSAPGARNVIYSALEDRNISVMNKGWDSYTNTASALESALQMAASFKDGNTAIILITDGTNTEDGSIPGSSKASIDMQSFGYAREIGDKGYALYVITLTNDGKSALAKQTKAYADDLVTEAGGDPDARVFEASSRGLLTTVQNIISGIRGINSTSVQARTPINRYFTIDAEFDTLTISVEFDPDDKQYIDTVSVTVPNGQAVEIWKNNGPTNAAGFTVSSDKNYIHITPHNPQMGKWLLTVIAERQIMVTTAYTPDIKMNLQMDNIAPVRENETKDVVIRLGRYINGTSVTLPETSGHYTGAVASITITDPYGKVASYKVNAINGRFKLFNVSFISVGNWVVSVEYVGKYVTVSDAFTVTVTSSATPAPSPSPVPTPTPSPTPVPTPTPSPTPVPVTYVDISVEPVASGLSSPAPDTVYIAKGADKIVVKGSVSGEIKNERIDWYADNSTIPFNSVDGNSSDWDAQYLPAGAAKYRVEYTVYDSYNVKHTAVKYFMLYPAPVELFGFTVSCGNPYGDGNNPGGVTLTDGNKAELTWKLTVGEVDDVLVYELDSAGNRNGAARSVKNAKKQSFDVKLSEGLNTTVQIIPVPKYGEEADGLKYMVQMTLTPKVYTFTEKLMKILLPWGAIAFGAIILAVIVALAIWQAKRPRLKGYLVFRINGESYGMDQMTLDLNGAIARKELSKIKSFASQCAGKPYASAMADIKLDFEKASFTGVVKSDPDSYDENNPKYMPDTGVLIIRTKGFETFYIASDTGKAECELFGNENYNVTFAFSDQNPYPAIPE